MATITPTRMEKISPSLKEIPVTPWIETWSNYNLEILNFDVSGTISGLVTLKGVPMPNEKVFLYYRPTGIKIRWAVTNALGAFTFQHLNKNSNQYYAVAMLKGPYTEPEKYNALIYDLLQPL